MDCKICNTTNSVKHWFEKNGYDYHYCISCTSLFTLEPLPNDNMIGGGNEVQRNEQQNAERIRRVLSLKEKPFVLDFGCGHGMLVNDFLEAKVNCIGYDKYNEEYDFLPEMQVDVVTMIEVIEHLSYPFGELDLINAILKEGGILYLETSFTDIPRKMHMNLVDFFYIDPLVGHATIFSHKGLDILMRQKGFIALEHLNDNVRLYQKYE